MNHNQLPQPTLHPLPIREIFERLEQRIPSGQWWPAETPFEIIVGAVLTQNTAWTNVEYALENLRAHDALAPEAILNLSDEALISAIRPAGYYNTKARYLREVSQWFLKFQDELGLTSSTEPGTEPSAENTNPLATAASHIETAELRRKLLAVTGVGPETADDILLYVFDRPVFIFDTYARRMFLAAGYPIPATTASSYEKTRRFLEPVVEEAGLSVQEHVQLHGLIVDGGKVARQLGEQGWQQLLGLLPPSHNDATATP